MKKKVLVLILCFILIGGTAAGALSSAGQIDTGNPDDKPENDIEVSKNDIGGNDYIFDADKDVDPRINVGDIRVVGDYMYVFGYRYTGSATGSISTTSLTGWTKQETKSWGCAVINHTKTSYSDPCGNIEGYNVTDFNRTYINCKNMKSLPLIPATATNTDELCLNDTAMTEAVIISLSSIGLNAFKGCTSLKKVYIGKSVTSMYGLISDDAPFVGVNSECVCYVEHATVPSGYPPYWDTGFKTVKMNADYAIDFMN